VCPCAGQVLGRSRRALRPCSEDQSRAVEGLCSGRGLDLSAFEQCVSSGTYRANVQQDIDEGTRAGVSGTPAFFINGRLVSGAQPLESFVRVIEDELARAR
jgi:predicted DsbA family dithiol-disulfide isomerase